MTARVEVIGECVLMLGDCLELMPYLKPVSHIITDPPYEAIMHEAKAKASGRGLRTDGGVELRPLGFEGIDTIREQVANEAARLSEGWALFFCSPEGVGRWADVINASPAKYKRACYWVKPDCTPQLNGQGPAMGGESFVAAWCGKGHARWNAGGKRGVYTHQCNPPSRHGGHPTEKPVSLMSELVNDFTSPNDQILDPFMGSGATGIACIKHGRRFIGIEQNPDYFEMACDRLRQAEKQPDLFVAPVSAKPKQMDLLEVDA